jgi:hypothetical protein
MVFHTYFQRLPQELTSYKNNRSRGGQPGPGARPLFFRDLLSYFPPPRRLYSDADTSMLDVLDYLGKPVGFIDFTTEFKYLSAVVHHSLTSDADVNKHIRSASTALRALKTF